MILYESEKMETNFIRQWKLQRECCTALTLCLLGDHIVFDGLWVRVHRVQILQFCLPCDEVPAYYMLSYISAISARPRRVLSGSLRDCKVAKRNFVQKYQHMFHDPKQSVAAIYSNRLRHGI